MSWLILLTIVAGTSAAQVSECTATSKRPVPLLYWSGGIQGAGGLKSAGILRVAVPSAEAAAWKQTGFTVTAISPADLEARKRIPAPRIDRTVQVASATRSPWTILNGWRFLREPTGRFIYELRDGAAALAAAEAFAYQGDALLAASTADIPALGEMLRSLDGLGANAMDPVSDFAFVDDGSSQAGEAMNLLVRRNLLFRRVTRAEPGGLVVRIGSPEYPRAEAADPSAFALKIRWHIGDQNRTIRLYGSETVIARVESCGRSTRIHLINYARQPIEGLRVRVRGEFTRSGLQDLSTGNGFTEFTLPRLEVYRIIELTR